jgi:hypothetical protein
MTVMLVAVSNGCVLMLRSDHEGAEVTGAVLAFGRLLGVYAVTPRTIARNRRAAQTTDGDNDEYA